MNIVAKTALAYMILMFLGSLVVGMIQFPDLAIGALVGALIALIQGRR